MFDRSLLPTRVAVRAAARAAAQARRSGLLLPLLLTLLDTSTAVGQGSLVTPGPEFTLRVNGAPFYPQGWNMLGTCLPPGSPPGAAQDSLTAHMTWIRRFGLNVVSEVASADGRLIPPRVGERWSNWYAYAYTSADGSEERRGHARPGAYVEAMRRYMDLAYYGAEGGCEGGARSPIYTLVSLHRFTVPEGQGRPYSGADSLRCDEYARFIEEERAQHAAVGAQQATRIPPVACGGPEVLPFWEWNVRYIVQSLRDHPGLLGWYLWDEPEGIKWRHLFGIVPPGEPVRAYAGPATLPTPDLLRHAYQRVVAFELEGQPTHYRRHPVVVDLVAPDAFFSSRFAWSSEGDLNPRTTSGPFDRTPDGRPHTPADVLGLEASARMRQTAALGDRPPHAWYWDQNIPARRAAMVRDAVARDGLWSAFVAAAQAQLSGPPYGLREPLRCPNPERSDLRLLNDRDLVWHLLTLQVDGARGQLYYALTLTPATGPGAEQAERINRLMQQFQGARLGEALMQPRLLTGWAIRSITVEALTNYFRSAPNFVGPADAYDAGTSAFSTRLTLTDPSAYRAGTFGRSAAPDTYGQPRMNPSGSTTYPDYVLLRVALHPHEGAVYLFVSNAYDARITADLYLDPTVRAVGRVEEGRFNLDAGGAFAWSAGPARLDGSPTPESGALLRIGLEPYEARVFRLSP